MTSPDPVATNLPAPADDGTSGITVSVVVPTIGRPELLRAVESALAQTTPVHEVVVVNDGSMSDDELSLPDDSRIRLVHAGGRGGCHARNLGISAATGSHIALLDDDDVWYPSKIERQLTVLVADRRDDDVIVTCQAYSEERRSVEPREPYESGSVAEYLFCRRGSLRQNAHVQASGLLFATRLGRRVPFDEALTCHQDWDWVVRATADHGATLRDLSEPLYVYSAGAGGRISATKRLADEQAWALATLKPKSREMFGYFTTVALPRAFDARDGRLWLTALGRAFTLGRFHVLSLLAGLLYPVHRLLEWHRAGLLDRRGVIAGARSRHR